MGTEVAEQITPEGGKLRPSSIAVKPGSGINFSNAAEIMAFAKMMADSNSAVPAHLRGSPGACLGVIDDSIRFRLSPFYCARQSYFVNDQLAYMAQLFAAVLNANLPLIKRPIYTFTGSSHSEAYKNTKGDTLYRATGDLVCKVELHLAGGQVIEHFSPPISSIKHQKSPLWGVDPRQQLAYYTIRSAGRLHFSDVLAGAYDVDEAAMMAELADIDDTPRIGKPKTDIGAKLREGRDNGHDHRDYRAGDNDSDDNGGSDPADGAGSDNDDGAISEGSANSDNDDRGAGPDQEKTSNSGSDIGSLVAEIQASLTEAGTRLMVEAVEEAYRDQIDAAPAEAQSLILAALSEARARFPEKRRRASAASKL